MERPGHQRCSLPFDHPVGPDHPALGARLRLVRHPRAAGGVHRVGGAALVVRQDDHRARGAAAGRGPGLAGQRPHQGGGPPGPALPGAGPADEVLAQCPEHDDWSLPSNHSAIAAAFAVALAAQWRKITSLVVLLALLEGFSRVFIGVHYPHDVLLG
ncbi:phosphatase PAP2 family protein, partial [Klebsiella pneumoniae]|nr:phosphatase PAP2 family protein [Klebsiella pneumoniae]